MGAGAGAEIRLGARAGRLAVVLRDAAFFVVRFLAGRLALALRAVVLRDAALFVVRFLAGRLALALRDGAFFVVRFLAGARRAGFRAAVLRAGRFRVVRFAAIIPPCRPHVAECRESCHAGRVGGGIGTLRLVARVEQVPATPGDQRWGVLRRWRHALATGNPPPGPTDPVTRWLVISRASVLPMTITAGLLALLLAWWNDDAHLDVGLWALAAVGLVLAHVANNLMNDLWDLKVGTDTERYPRALYAPHPVLSGMTTRRGLLVRALAANVADLAILGVLVAARDAWIIAFALGGFVLSVAYTAPPLRLKKHGLGEPTVFVVWGPLMVGGTYYAAVGHLPWQIVVASMPYALLCTAVLMGKHVDKIPWDQPDGTRTLPVLLGERRARAATRAMMLAFYPLVGLLVAVGTLPVLSLVCLLGLLRLAKIWKPFSAPKPDQPPEGFPIWPLWFAALAFVHTRRAGGLLLLGMLLGILIGH